MATSMKDLQDQVDDLQDTIDQASDILEDAYAPESERGDLIEAVSEALDLLAGEEEPDQREDED